MRSLTRSVALQSTGPGVLRAAVDATRELLGCDTAFAAIAVEPAAFRITLSSGVRGGSLDRLVIRPGLGLGGQVLTTRRPMCVANYLHEPSITRDYASAVEREGLRSVACVPIARPDGTDALLYAASRGVRQLGDAAVDALVAMGATAEVGLHHVAARARELELARRHERERLATRLHGSVAQSLFAISAAARRPPDDRCEPHALRRKLCEIEATAAHAGAQLRATLWDLDLQSQPGDLEAHLDGELRLLERTTGCTVHLVRRGRPRPLPELVEQLVVDTSMEGVQNAIKHAAARLVVVLVAFDVRSVTVVVQAEVAVDTTAPTATRAWTSGTGLERLATRALGLGGRLDLRDGQDGAKVLRLDLPTAKCP